jgi:homoserine O-acetyltransferase
MSPFVVPPPQVFNHPAPFAMVGGGILPSFSLTYETYGSLNADRSNAVLVCHALSANHHVAGVYADSADSVGWWDHVVGPGKPLDTRDWFVIGVNNLGGCHGSTGPSSINPNTQKRYAGNFPKVTVEDWVNSQALLLDFLGIAKLAAVIGGSLGGMQALQWSINFPDRLNHAVIIASTAKLTTQNIAFNDVARQAILSDPDFHGGHYYDHNTSPRLGLRIARMLGHITYLSDEKLAEKFGRERKQNDSNHSFGEEFEIESYLRYQGEKFAEHFDANTYLLMTKALDYFDPAARTGALNKAFSHTQCRFLIVSFDSDWRFEPAQSWNMVQALLASHRPVVYSNISSPHGHDSFLIPNEDYFTLITAYFQHMKQEIIPRNEATDAR